ncbi:glycosyltransferase family 8 protein [Glaesserella parasuis]|uniref:glycosyltransferase family 8 protein n=1 Tax=Glaesserella parasuis TaxID=738 RepID=UPI00243711F5|nr:glycosyltransferase family 8 protein [Glaesserella parasuis]MDG6369689.1 glycosyltransferase family 8 protein [Glaesserella parasuis]MDG6844533.1 glycosyltransferase family 8 protein [Glaesserella parasuis]
MNIVFCCDEKYSPYLAVNILSILNHHKIMMNFYVLDLGISSESKECIINIVDNHRGSIEFIPINEDDFSEFPQTISHISKTTYARLKIADYVKNVDKVIYLDIDLLIAGSIIDLWNINLDKYHIAACFDSFVEYGLDNYKAKIGFNESNSYFNAGVLLIDLNKLKNFDLYTKAIVCIKEYPYIEFQDQDILNIIFKNKVKIINTKYNFQPYLRYRILKKQQLSDQERPNFPISIFHYCGEDKPWHSKCNHTKSQLFIKLFNSINNKPQHWLNKVAQNDYRQIFKKLKNDFKDRIKFGIY